MTDAATDPGAVTTTPTEDPSVTTTENEVSTNPSSNGDDTPLAEEARHWGFTEAEGRQLLEAIPALMSMQSEFTGFRRDMDTKYGGVMSKLKSIGEQRTLTKEQLKKVSELYGEDLAEAMAADLAGVMQQPGVSKDDLLAEAASLYETKFSEQSAQLREQVKAELRREMQEERLEEKYPGWKEIAKSADMQLFESLLPPDKQQQLEEDFRTKPFDKVMGKVLEDFNKWKDARARRGQQKRELEESVNPRGTGSGESTGGTLAEEAERAAQALRNRSF